MDLQRVTDRAAAVRWHALSAAASAHDFVALPADPLDDVLPLLSGDGAAGKRTELYLDADGLVLGDLGLPVHDNLVEATLTVSTHPDARRGGLGSAMLGALVARCEELGRTRLLTQVPGHLDGTASAGEHFARSHGFTPMLAEVRRVLDVATVDLSGLQRLADEAWPHAEGYRLVSWVDRAASEHRAGLAALAGRMSLDAPTGDIERDPEVWDAARWTAGEDDAVARGRLRLGTLALHGADVVAYTDFGIPGGSPEVGYQWDTIVRADHRGHRLGMLVKIANLRQLLERSPRTRWVNTWNAAVNAHMISINEALGWRAVDTWAEWQRDL